jgi:hypothetical protein
MSATSLTPTTTRSAAPTRPASGRHPDAPSAPDGDRRLVRTSARFGVAFTICQLTVMVFMALFVLPQGGSPSDPPLTRGQNVFDAQTAYRLGNYGFMLAGTLLLGFLGALGSVLRRVDRSGVLATVAVSCGALLALIWPLGGVLHDVALETASAGADLHILAGWDSVAPFTLAFSVFPRVFLIGAVTLGLRMAGTGAWLQRAGWVLVPLSLVGSATLVSSALFPLLALTTLGYELWVGALAWHLLRSHR